MACLLRAGRHAEAGRRCAEPRTGLCAQSPEVKQKLFDLGLPVVADKPEELGRPPRKISHDGETWRGK